MVEIDLISNWVDVYYLLFYRNRKFDILGG